MYIPALIFPLWTCWHMSFPEKPKHAHCLLYIPPLTSTLSPSIIFTFSQLSAAHHFKKKPFIMLRVCMCVNCRYKAALAWAQMKTHSWQGIGEYRLLRCWQMFFLHGGQITVCVKKIWLSLVDSCKSQVNLNIKWHSQPIFSGWNRIFGNKQNTSNTFYSLFTLVFLFHALLHSHSSWWAHLSFMWPYLWIHTAVSHKHLTTVILL